jgi:hypothetical protein
VQFDLVDRGGDARLGDDALEVRHEEVRNAGRTREPPIADRDDLLPGVHVVVPRRGRPVHEVEVDVVEAELLQALRDGRIRLVAVVAVVPQLGRHEQLVTRDAALRDGRTDPGLAAVDRGGVDVAVPISSASLTVRSVSAGSTLKTP